MLCTSIVACNVIYVPCHLRHLQPSHAAYPVYPTSCSRLCHNLNIRDFKVGLFPLWKGVSKVKAKVCVFLFCQMSFLTPIANTPIRCSNVPPCNRANPTSTRPDITHAPPDIATLALHPARPLFAPQGLLFRPNMPIEINSLYIYIYREREREPDHSLAQPWGA